MKYISLIALILIIMLKQTAQCQSGDTTAYKLVWADEFNNEGPVNAKYWRFEHGFTRNNELQWYQPQNAVCHNGLLVIEAQKVHLPNPNYVAGSKSWKTNREFIEYTASSMNTSGLKEFKYGRFVMRGKIDVDSGLWPAFWTLGAKGQWPSNGEIDIMEYYRGMLLANIATGTDVAYKAHWFSTTKEVKLFGPEWCKQFHVWRMDWDKNAISLYVDDELLNRVEMKDLNNRDAEKLNPFKQPHYILLNLAVGGDNGGDPSLTKFPKRFEVDYVKVYQKQ
ncbi:glycoside hydrolase family 16 protein [Mucilaginibacter sp. ZT4R22]|uniref:Glycoside hydrolase family 16 protein n=2 Tax=Mucilaginibacter pankratovii TaxID=2772110 RepID=A0ABR7WLM8_9SPHI|nr:glycoside hydrolase family 16 protein [Mucilaginibacter pankratovii]